AVFTVEDDADQRRVITLHGGPYAVQLAQEVVGRRDRVAALIVEADHVAQGVVAENDAKLRAVLNHLVGPVQVVGIPDVALRVAEGEPRRGRAGDVFVRRDPPDAVLVEEGKHRLTNGAFGRPRPTRGCAEPLRVHFDGPANVNLGIVDVAAAIAR